MAILDLSAKFNARQYFRLYSSNVHQPRNAIVTPAGSLVLDIFRGPIQIVIGLLYGIIFGLLLWLIPTKHFVSLVPKYYVCHNNIISKAIHGNCRRKVQKLVTSSFCSLDSDSLPSLGVGGQ